MERDSFPSLTLKQVCISTHTLTWSVTEQFCNVIGISKISTHTLTWSVTVYQDFKRKGKKNFNSHAHVERDCKQKISEHNNGISTHTLTWSVTFKSRRMLRNVLDFNSHAHVERDIILTKPIMGRTYFNSHAHVERDPEIARAFCSLKNFNSHAHVERDYTAAMTGTLIGISTHTLTWSVTDFKRLDYFRLFISTHTLTWSVTLRRFADKYGIPISTHTLTWSVTGGDTNVKINRPYFNSHAHVERDCCVERYPDENIEFQLTRSRGA